MKMSQDINPLYAAVFPKGWLGDRLHNVSNPRRHRWNIYLRACKRIPKSSPVHGCTDWKKINHRRHTLIEKFINEDIPKDAEYLALQEIAGVAFCSSTVVQNFLLARILRRLKQPARPG